MSSFHKKTFSLLYFCLFNFIAFGQASSKKTEAAFQKACLTVTEAFTKKNMPALDKFIDPHTGVYIITRPGAIDVAANHKKVEESTVLMNHYSYKDSIKIKKHKLIYATAPRFNCGDNKWDKNGFVADSATHYHRITEVMSMRTKYEGEKHSEEEIEKIKSLENTSRKIVLTNINKGRGLVFYLTLVKGKWYLLLIDTVEGSCEA